MTFFTQKNLIPIVLLLATVTVWSQDAIYENNFDHLSSGQYNEEEMKAALGANFCKGADEGRVSIETFQGQGNVLKVKYPKGKVKTNDSGMHTKVFWDNYASFDELYFSYRVYIPRDFEFRAGAKLPGLGYQTNNRNMSLRLMWREDGLLEFYNHFETRPSWEDWTASVNWSLTDPYDEQYGPQPDQVKLKKGAWNHIEVYHKLNSPGKRNGIMRGWLNGELAINITNNEDYRQREEGDIQLNTIYWSTFFGGSSDAFKPTKDQYAYFDDVVVSRTRIGNSNPDEGNEQPFEVSFKTPSEHITVQEGYHLAVEVNANDPRGYIKEVQLFLNDNFIRKERRAPYTWGHGTSNSQELNGLTPGVYTLKARAINHKNNVSEASILLTVTNYDGCALYLPDSHGLEPIDNVYFNYAHIIGLEDSQLLYNFVNLSLKWNPQYDELSKFAFQTNNGSPGWYIDFSKTADYQLKNAQPEITLKNTGFSGLDNSYWVTLQNNQLILKSKDGRTLICFSNSAVQPACMVSKHKKVVTIHNTQKLRLKQNPVHNVLSIVDLPASAHQVKVFALNGNLVLSKPISTKTSVDIQVNQLPGGLYLAEIQLDHGESMTSKFMKE
ncbi:T9SS type A sorting domain-containing protein [Aquimarina sp. U1-2]|uniref:polysaccharide lyase n=1 Tax=Aquimarina sp. U1-2 TaxID=2823141 RepID=UPI001AECA1D9|nr:Ig-like domain-containing protein [Aquimarina sp. U1-2]MBP2833221.1 T9SS type A sorting domain-containing protein [Aquimarina sp. U1-2]